MLTKAIVQTSSPVEFNIESVDPDEILILTSISGLSKAGAALYTGEFTGEGGYYQGRRANPRNPVMNFKINPNYKEDIEASDVREMLYRQFMEPREDSDGVQVLLVDDRKPDRYFIGYCEDIDADIFEKEIRAVVSMVTTDPYLRSAAETVKENANGWYSTKVNYDGSADTSVEITLKVLAMCNQIVLKNNDQTLTLDGLFQPGDAVVINTSARDRSVKRNGADVMVRWRAGSKWIQLKQSNNAFVSYGDAPGDGKVVMTKFKYRSAWWGV